MRLRKAQIEELAKSATADFHERLKKFLREELPGETAALDDDAIMERIRDSERRASRYGIDSELGIAQFTCLTFAVQPPLDEIPEVRAFLEAPGMEGDEKVDELVDYLNAIEDGDAVPLDEHELDGSDDHDIED